MRGRGVTVGPGGGSRGRLAAPLLDHLTTRAALPLVIPYLFSARPQFWRGAARTARRAAVRVRASKAALFGAVVLLARQGSLRGSGPYRAL